MMKPGPLKSEKYLQDWHFSRVYIQIYMQIYILSN